MSTTTARPPRPRVDAPTEYGNAASFWVEYPSGLVDLTRATHLPPAPRAQTCLRSRRARPTCPSTARARCASARRSAFVIIDMQNYFLHPDIRSHPKGLECVAPLTKTVSALRAQGVKILWVNWGLTEHELTTIPPSLVRGFRKGGGGGFGSQMAGVWGRLLMRGERNADLYGPLQDLYLEGKAAGTDVWIHKNRMSALWGYQTALDLYLRENGITTLFFAGVNTDQCVLGTLVDAYYRDYDVIVVQDTTATSSPEGGFENVIYNAGGSYGFVTDSERVAAAASSK
ncbi:Isochorismatase hydrolase [Gloeopeniophorella convolvens]|nr:Isochorismatase hydrolase [Gloeopeniophorella convolvens]